jgi:hypothetical protein
VCCHHLQERIEGLIIVWNVIPCSLKLFTNLLEENATSLFRVEKYPKNGGKIFLQNLG